jgi:hypothetical protein
VKLFVVSIERGTSSRFYHRRPWLTVHEPACESSPVGSFCVLAVAPSVCRTNVTSLADRARLRSAPPHAEQVPTGARFRYPRRAAPPTAAAAYL